MKSTSPSGLGILRNKGYFWSNFAYKKSHPMFQTTANSSKRPLSHPGSGQSSTLFLHSILTPQNRPRGLMDRPQPPIYRASPSKNQTTTTQHCIAHSRSFSRIVTPPRSAAPADLSATPYTFTLPRLPFCCYDLQALLLCPRDCERLALLLSGRAPIAKRASLSCRSRNSARRLSV